VNTWCTVQIFRRRGHHDPGHPPMPAFRIAPAVADACPDTLIALVTAAEARHADSTTRSDPEQGLAEDRTGLDRSVCGIGLLERQDLPDDGSEVTCRRLGQHSFSTRLGAGAEPAQLLDPDHGHPTPLRLIRVDHRGCPLPAP
jgi:hypothetical protein